MLAYFLIYSSQTQSATLPCRKSVIETNFPRALSILNQDFLAFFTRPVCAVFLAISLFLLRSLL